jgi:hypothetical protein
MATSQCTENTLQHHRQTHALPLSSGDDGGLDGLEIAAIVLSVVAASLAIAAGVAYYLHRRWGPKYGKLSAAEGGAAAHPEQGALLGGKAASPGQSPLAAATKGTAFAKT